MRHTQFFSCILVVVALCLLSPGLAKGVLGFACNWGRVSTQPLPGDIAVRLMKDNGFDKVKLFDADPEALDALANSGIQVMVGIGNYYLGPLNNTKVADDWVAKNVSIYVKNGVDIRYVAVSNEAFLKDYGDTYVHSVLPALKNIKASLDKAGLGKKVQVTIPLNADIYETESGLPSGGDFRANVTDEVVEILKFLNDNNAPVAINIYPFLSLYYDSHFPKDYAFLNGSSSNAIVDGDITYTNAFDGNLDTLVSALEKHGVGSMAIIVGEVGWPTDGNANANNANAQRFYQGLVDRINNKKGPPKRPNDMPEVYMFGLLDEDAKSVQPGDFEPHWGIFNYDGSIKYQLDLGDGKKLVPAKGVKYMKKQWCVLSPKASIDDPKMKENWKIACGASTGCTSVGNGSSCEGMDNRTKASFAFNAFYQVTNQNKDGCKFNGLSIITDQDPSPPNGTTCKFNIALDVGELLLAPSPAPAIEPSPEDSSTPPVRSRTLDPGSKSSLAVSTKQNSVTMVVMVLSLMLIIIL